MKPVEIRLLAICPSCLTGSGVHEQTRLGTLLQAAADHVTVRVLVRGDLRQAQLEAAATRETTIVIGSTGEDLTLIDDCVLYLHVGEEVTLDRSLRRLVPLWGQYATGVANAVEHLLRRGFREVLIQHADVIDFVDRSIEFYESIGAVATALSRHQAITRALHDAFGGRIRGIFATGFPFYVDESDLAAGVAHTPESILRYLREQRYYFDSKLIDEAAFEERASGVFDGERASTELGLRLSRNAYDVYEYVRSGHPPPTEPERGTLRELGEGTAFNVRQDPWPCQLCVGLQAPDLQPSQRVEKDTNETCLRCRQTSLMLRNVSGCSVDFDMVVVVDGDVRAASAEIKDHVLHATEAHLYDLDLPRMIANYDDGPLDLFVAAEPAVIAALGRMRDPDWLNVEFPTSALWSLTLHGHMFNLGEDFPVAFDPQTPLSAPLRDALDDARRSFATRHAPDDVLATLRGHSSARKQLLSNPEIVDALLRRLERWRDQGDQDSAYGQT
jgi:hypothetical protein